MLFYEQRHVYDMLFSFLPFFFFYNIFFFQFWSRLKFYNLHYEIIKHTHKRNNYIATVTHYGPCKYLFLVPKCLKGSESTFLKY